MMLFWTLRTGCGLEYLMCEECCDVAMCEGVERWESVSFVVELKLKESRWWWAGVVFPKGVGGGCGIGALLYFRFGTGLALLR